MRLLVVLTCLALAGCTHDGGSTNAPAADTGTTGTTSPARTTRDVQLQVEDLSANPPGPTTASTITLHFNIANHGQDCTPYHSVAGTLSYVPIIWVVYRDGIVVAQGEVDGMTGADSVPTTVVLQNQPEGDRSYTVQVDPDDRIAPENRATTRAGVSVRFGGSG